mmetsp:Transcript_37769/g.70901  ORF Transcript_37769/g.70901 Transcript_37769/m.70901 type:complete len:235 (+) Transcript_37769:116-820(+)|eukprot:CAMPEP_0114232250 /NCGR_PEP_ID=MMETSP0058-20121206/4501_1 /TAXON_ID=36894 /ORGANISM="Pyramimonas parkeae, CCMP726" /LENGTH=234 /DNA_ID=CAMNT_0001343701 /DNA_START=88 /DNA_END=792 /DNA_ORIENTATION=+
MSASLRNAVKRKTHKERSQPAARKKLGLLEKHKDYVLRAKDFHRKEKTLKNLKEKAEFRNPDEFYFAMQKSRTKDGVHIGNVSDGNKYTTEELSLMKTQDMTYVQHKAQGEIRKAERLQSSLHGIGDKPVNKKIIFVDNGEDAQSFNASERCAVATEDNGGPAISKDVLRAREKSYGELKARSARAEKMIKIAQGMALQQQLMGKSGHKRKIRARLEDTGERTTVYRWKKERKK